MTQNEYYRQVELFNQLLEIDDNIITSAELDMLGNIAFDIEMYELDMNNGNT